MSKLALVEFIKYSELDSILTENFEPDPWHNPDEVKLAARTYTSDQKQETQTATELAEPIKQALSAFITQELPLMRGSTDRVTLEELIRMRGGDIKNIVNSQDVKPRSLYMLGDAVRNFMKNQANKSAVAAFLKVYGSTPADWILKFTPKVGPIGTK